MCSDKLFKFPDFSQRTDTAFCQFMGRISIYNQPNDYDYCTEKNFLRGKAVTL